jgi:uncharacterized protein (DUF1501 family)
VLTDTSRGLENSEPAAPPEEFDRRTRLLNQLEQQFVRDYPAPAAQAHEAGLASALRLIRSDRRGAFDLSREPEASRRAYGASDFGQGCLLARRLVEAGVPFVEVYLANWDSHFRDVAAQTRTLMSQVDAGMSALIRDLHGRGLLESTLVIWMGEFGRTPRINQQQGRDHYPNAWTTVLAGGGIRGGQVYGATGADGMNVDPAVGRAVNVPDFLATVCRALGLDPARQNMSNVGRPIRLVDHGARAIQELVA